MRKSLFKALWMPCVLGMSLAACSDDDNTTTNGNGGEEGGTNSSVSKYIVVAASGGTSTNTYVLAEDDLSSGSATIVSGGGATQVGSNSSFTHYLFPDNRWAFFLSYQQGNDAILNYGYLDESGNFKTSSMEMETPHFTAFGTADKYVLLAGDTKLDKYDASDTGKEHPMQGISFAVIDPEVPSKTSYTLEVEDFAGDGEYYTLSGFIPVGDKIYSSFLPTGFSDYFCTYKKDEIPEEYQEDIVSSGRGDTKTLSCPTLTPDKFYIAIYDDVASFGTKPSGDHLIEIKDAGVSLPYSRYRSQFYSTLCAADDYIYIFSNSLLRTSTTVVPKQDASVIRFDTKTNTVDSSFPAVDIEQLSKAAFGDARSFFQVWYMGNDKFLINFYDDADMSYTKMNTFGIYDVTANAVTAISGMPSASAIESVGRFIQVENGKAYLPVTLNEGTPTVYVVDAASSTATPGLLVTADGGIAGIGKLHN